MKKTTTHLGGMSPVTDFKPQRAGNYAPEIKESFVDDLGDVQHILSNGNTLSENNYIKHWGQPKGVIMPQGYKGKGLDPRTNFIK